MKKYIISLLALFSAETQLYAMDFIRVNLVTEKSSRFNTAKVSEVTNAEEETSINNYKTSKTVGGVTESGKVADYGYVDLGLPSGTLWATRNVGAYSLTDEGGYSTWGASSGGLSWKSYPLCDGSEDKLNKYCTNASIGNLDNKTVLEPVDDGATKSWGGPWRTPTAREMEELISGCDWKWVSDFDNTDVSGMLGTSKTNGNTIFLPSTGLRYYYEGKVVTDYGGYYWTSSLGGPAYNAKHLKFDKFKNMLVTSTERVNGMNLRAVISPVVTYMNVKTTDGNENKFDVSTIAYVDFEDEYPTTVSGTSANHTYVDLGLPSGTKWATYNVGASVPVERGGVCAWAETDTSDRVFERYNYEFYKVGKFTKYVVDTTLGTVDNLTVLEPEDDIATASWGEEWRMPTKEDYEELIENCDWKWSDGFLDSGVAGYVGTSKINGNTIFFSTDFRFSSYRNRGGDYWTSSLKEDSTEIAYCFFLVNDGRFGMETTTRWNGCNVRAVLAK